MTHIHSVAASSSMQISGQNFEDDSIDSFYQHHLESYNQFDFATPFLALIERACGLKNLTLDEKKTWILSAHGKIVEQAYSDSTQRRISLACSESLMEVLLGLMDRKGLFIQDSSLFYRYFYLNDKFEANIGAFTEKLIHFMDKHLRENNPVPMFEVIYWMHFFYFRRESIENIVKNALNKIDFEEGSPHKELFLKMVPGIFNAFDSASKSYLSLTSQNSFAYKKSDSCVFL